AGCRESGAAGGRGLWGWCAAVPRRGRGGARRPSRAASAPGAGGLPPCATPYQPRRGAAPAGRGELILTAALPEEDGDDPRVPSASAEPVKGDGEAGGGWLLSGVKTAVFAAPLAALLLVPTATADGAAVFLVVPGDEGVTV